MKIEVVGYQRMEFKNSSGEVISGTKIFSLMNPTNAHIVGKEVLLRPVGEGKVFKAPFVPSSVAPSIELGLYDVEFDIKGSISSFKPCK